MLNTTLAYSILVVIGAAFAQGAVDAIPVAEGVSLDALSSIPWPAAAVICTYLLMRNGGPTIRMVVEHKVDPIATGTMVEKLTGSIGQAFQPLVAELRRHGDLLLRQPPPES